MFGKKIETNDSVDVLLSELDQHLRQAMSVEPSDDFAKNVRARIDEQRGHGEWWGWQWAAAAACVLAIAIGWRVANTPAEERRAATAGSPASADVQLAAVPAPPVRVERQVNSTPALRLRTPIAPTKPLRDAMSPEVIVPEENARAMARLLALARSGRIDEEKLKPVVAPVSSPTLDVPPLGVTAIAIPDIEIENGPPTADREK